MKILSLETSTPKFSLAVSDDEKILVGQSVKLKGVLSSSIIPTIERILNKARMKFRDIDCLAVGLGPGSFTSLRVGLSTVKALSLAMGMRVVGIPSLDALALAVTGKTGFRVCSLMDAKRNMVYACLYESDSGKLIRKSDYLLSGIEDLLKKITDDVVFVGDGVKLFRESIVDEIEKRVNSGRVKAVFTDERLWYPQAKYLAQIAFERVQHNKFDNPDSLTPLYLYPDHCQISKGVSRSTG